LKFYGEEKVYLRHFFSSSSKGRKVKIINRVFLDKIFPNRLNNSTKFNIITRSSQLIISTFWPFKSTHERVNFSTVCFSSCLIEKRIMNLLTDFKVLRIFSFKRDFSSLKNLLWEIVVSLKKQRNACKHSEITYFHFFFVREIHKWWYLDDHFDACKVPFLNLVSDFCDFSTISLSL